MSSSACIAISTTSSARGASGTFRAELQYFAADDDGRVVGYQRSTGERNGQHLEVGNCIVFTLQDGRVVDGGEHFHDRYARDEFWSYASMP